jgi:4-amino-4-deoxy-L-arabinose transferase-like glycosyltransferase
MGKFKKVYLVVLVILLIGLFFRSFDIVSRFEFAHDGDLYSWIVKDIVVNHHLRLIGQLTTAKGIFIGPLFYYSLVPFFLLTNMNPIGALIPITIIAMLALISYYFVFSKLFNSTTGLIAMFLEATSLSVVQLDRNVAPSTPTNLWVVWYFYCLINLARGNFSVLPILGLLVALIWHIHIALAPALLAVPFAIILSKKFPSLKQIAIFIAVTFIFSLPLLAFEFKHGFSQTFSFIQNLHTNQGGGVGWPKFQLLLIKATLNIDKLLFYPPTLPFIDNNLLIPTILLSALILVKKQLIKVTELVPLYLWVLGVFIFYTFSSTIISEYYLSNYEIVFITILSLWLSLLFRSKLGKILLILLFSIILIKNAFYFVTEDYYHKGYVERKAVANYIATDSRQKGFPCVSVSYITAPGENVGFRYFFYLDNLHVNQSKSGSPDYTIVLPDELAEGAIDKKFEHIGVIIPKNIPSKSEITQSCSGQNSNLTDPLFGYTE